MSRVLLLGGLIGVVDPIVTSGRPAGTALAVFVGLVLFALVIYLHRARDLERAIVRSMTIAMWGTGMVFTGNFALTGEAFFFSIGFAIPLSAAMFLRSRSAVNALCAYVGAGLLVSVGLQYAVWVPPYLGSLGSVVENTANAGMIIVAMCLTVVWKEQLLSSATDRELTQRQRLETVFSSGYGGVLEANEDGYVVFAAGRVLQDLGFRIEDLLGKKQLDLLCDEDQETFRKALRGQVEPFTFDTEARAYDGQGRVRWIRVSGGTHRTRSGRLKWVTAVQDIHDQVMQRRQVEELSRIESLGIVCAGLAHDFNNLLTVIGMHSELIEDPETREPIMEAHRQAADVTAGLLAFARKQRVQERDLDFAAFMNGLHPLMRRILPASVRFNWRVDAKPCVVRADPGQLQQVLINLVTNAQHAMPDGGEIEVATSVVRGCPPGVLEATCRGQFVRLSVRDTGCGMSPEVQARSIEPFFTTKPRGQGTGLGLATALGVVRQAGGGMKISSLEGRGTTIDVYLPLAGDGASVIPLSRPPSPPPVTIQGTRVLLVEDRALVARAIRKTLQHSGCEVTVRTDAEAGLATLEGQHDFDVLVTDVVLPGMSGIEFVRRILPDYPQLPVLIMSAHPQQKLTLLDDYPQRVVFLPKPFPFESLNEVVARLLGRNSEPVERTRHSK